MNQQITQGEEGKGRNSMANSDNQPLLDQQRDALRTLMVLESRIARLRLELTKPIDITHPDNPAKTLLKKELDWVKSESENALGKIGAFIAEAERRTGWSNFSRYKQRQHDTDRAVRDADALFDAALAEQHALKETLAPNNQPSLATDAPTNEENQ